MENFVFLAGHVGADAEVRDTRTGQVANFRLATARPKRDDQGRVVRDPDTGYRVDDTEWHRITAFNGLARSAAGIRKGMAVSVQGRIHNTEWTDRESGEKRFSYEIIAERITFLTRRKEQEAGADDTD